MEENPAALDARGPQRVIIATLRAWVGSWLSPYGKCRMKEVNPTSRSSALRWMSYLSRRADKLSCRFVIRPSFPR
jgi:hypothetical protein